MANAVLGVFSDRVHAEEAIEELREKKYNTEDMSIVVRDTAVAQDLQKSTGASVADGAAAGASTGAVIGGLAGLLVGIGAIAIPGIGGLLIAGPLAAALGLTGAAATTVSGAVTGALAGGLVGALVGLGIPENEAKEYEERVREGAILLFVTARSGRESEPEEIMKAHGAEKIRTLDIKYGT